MKVIFNNRKTDLKAFRWEKLRNEKQKGLICFYIYLPFEIIKVISVSCRKVIQRLQKSKKSQENAQVPSSSIVFPMHFPQLKLFHSFSR